MSAEPTDLVTVSRAELDTLRADVRRLRRQIAREEAKSAILSDPGPGATDRAPTFSREELAEAWGISD
ncbi:MAG: hypothetical protein QM650_15400 [Microlunatus sp.]